jgi:hypothetical protein
MQYEWMDDSYVGVQWFDHYLAYTKPTAEDPAMLMSDGHLAHTRNLEVVEKARENSVTTLGLPLHSAH